MYLRGRIDGEFQLGLLSVVDRESLHEQRGEPWAGPPSEAVEDEESLEAGALVGQLAAPVQHQVDDLLADGVVAASVVIGCVLLASDQLLGVEQLAVGTCRIPKDSLYRTEEHKMYALICSCPD